MHLRRRSSAAGTQREHARTDRPVDDRKQFETGRGIAEALHEGIPDGTRTEEHASSYDERSRAGQHRGERIGEVLARSTEDALGHLVISREGERCRAASSIGLAP